MMQSLAPRGPDGAGIVQRNHITLGHRRLKIIDLSESAEQPMTDALLGLSIVYNGALYNYPQLREELTAKGYQFFSHGDTEVVLKAYHAWGEECVKRFNGMFAFAILERDTHRLFFGRDRLGIKPFYYTRTADRFAFASSLPALLNVEGVDTSLDPIALNYYLSFHAVVPAPHTILNGIRKLPPAHTATLEPDGRWSEKSYWSLHFGATEEERHYGLEDWKAATLEVLRKSVERRMIADVPVGVLLSGGLDSSLVVGLLAEQHKVGIETFSIGFETVGDERGDEFQYSDIIAERFATNHHQLFVDSSRALPQLRQCIGAMSEPMVSHDNIGFYMLSQEVAKHVKVVQSGQGADEIFAGYHWYPPMMKASDALQTYSESFFDRDFAEYREVVAERFHDEDHARAFVRSHFALSGAEHPIDKALRLDALIMLVDDPVKRVDNHSMAAGLEARVPFLDHEVVEFAARVPAEHKVRAGGKYVLAEAARSVIPSAVIDRPKGYFPVPALKYLRGPFLELARDALTNDAARKRGLFQPAYVERLLADPETHITPLRGSKLWQLSLLELWLQTHGIT